MEETEEYVPFELKVRCPHCDKVCTVKVHINSDDDNTLTAFELLSSFEMKGKKDEGAEKENNG